MKKLSRIRFVPLGVSILFELFCIVNLSGASLPFPDPTQQMLEKQLRQIVLYEKLLFFGGLAIALSLIFALCAKKFRWI